MTNARLLMRREFTPDHAQLEFGDSDGEYPQWEFGAEPLVANEHKVVVASLPELEGDAVIEVCGRVRINKYRKTPASSSTRDSFV